MGTRALEARRAPRLVAAFTAVALTIMSAGLMVVAGAAPAAAADPLDCNGDAVYLIRQNGQVHRVSADTGVVTPTAAYDGATAGTANQVGISSGGRSGVNSVGTSSVSVYDAAPGTVTSVARSGAAGTVAGGVNPATDVYYYGGFSAEDGAGARLLSLYAYNLTTRTDVGLVATITVPNAPGGNTGTNTGGNGDVAFSASGSLYIVSSAPSSARLYRFATALPTTAVGTPVTGTATSVSLIATTAAVNGIAYGGNGYLYLSTATAISKVESSTGALVATQTLTVNGSVIAGSTSTDLGSCATPSTVTIKASFPEGRAAGDQVTVALTGGGIVTPFTGTTGGTELGVQDQQESEYAGPVPVIPGSTYSASTTAAGSMNLANYVASYICTNDTTGTTLSSGESSAFSVAMPTVPSDVECVVSFAHPSPAISLAKSATPATVSHAGEAITYTFGVTNTGNRPLTGLDVTDPMPGLDALVCTPTPLGGTLAAGASTTCTASASVTPAQLAGASIVNTATASGTALASGSIPAVTVFSSDGASVAVVTLPPIAIDDVAATTPEAAVTLEGATNDEPGEAGGAAVIGGDTVFTSPAATSGGSRLTTSEGDWAVNADGTVTFAPAPGFTGVTVPVEYRIVDVAGKTDTATLTVLVREGPTAAPDAASTAQNITVAVDPLANDSAGLNADGTAATFDGASFAFPASGTATLTIPTEGVYTAASDGTVSFDPEPGFTGPTTPVAYRVENSLGLEVSSTISITVTPIVPTATSDIGYGAFDQPVSLAAMLNDSTGAASAPLAASAATFPATGQPPSSLRSPDERAIAVPGQGTFVLWADDGDATFWPDAGFVGTTSQVTYRIVDANGTAATATLQAVVRSGPAALPDSDSTPQNVTVAVDVLANDTPGLLANGDSGSFALGSLVLTGGPAGATLAPDGLSLTVPDEGTYMAGADGSIAFDPEPQFTGTAGVVTYSVADAAGNLTGSTLTIEVTPITPIATDDAAATAYLTPVSLGAATTDTAGAASAPLDLSSVEFPSTGQPAGAVVGTGGRSITVPGEGFFEAQPDGTVTFSPVAFAGATSPVAYRVADANGTTATALLRVTVRTGPVARADSAATVQAIPVDVLPLANDDPSRTAADLPGAWDDASLRLTAAGLPADASVGADGLSATVMGEGSYAVAGAVVTFTPLPGFTGPATPVAYVATDAVGNVAGSTISITVGAIVPVARDDSAATPYDTPVDLDVLDNDEPGGATAPLDPGSVVFPGAGQPAGASVASDGLAITVAGQGVYAVDASGRVTFTPTGFTGVTSPVTYTVADANGTLALATITVTVGAGPVAAPDARGTLQNVAVDVAVLANDTGSALTPTGTAAWVVASVRFPVAGQPAGATVAADGLSVTVPSEGVYTAVGGVVTFDPARTFTGAASPIAYGATDALGNDAGSTVTITVTPIVPVANDDVAFAAFNHPAWLTGATDDEAGHASAPLDLGSVRFPSTGQPVGATVDAAGTTLAVPGEGSFTAEAAGGVSFQPVVGFTGATSLVRYEVSDANGTTATATLAVTVRQGPVAVVDFGSTPQNVSVTVEDLANDTPGVLPSGAAGAWDVATLAFPAAGQPAGATVSNAGATLTVPAQGTYSAPGDGSVVFEPLPDFTGPASPILYEVVDSLGNPASAEIRITVIPVIPSAQPDSGATPYRTPVTSGVASNDIAGSIAAPIVPGSVRFATGGQPGGAAPDAAGTTLEIAGEGDYVVGPLGAITFTPAEGFVGVARSVLYRVDDANGTETGSSLTIVVRPGPLADDDSGVTAQGVPVAINALDGDVAGLAADGSAGALVAGSVVFTTGTAALTVASEGSYSVTGGVVTFTPVPSFTGATTPVRYWVTDEFGNTDSAWISVLVSPIIPAAQDDVAHTPFATPVAVDVVANDDAGAASAPLDASSVRLPALGQPAGAVVASDGLSLELAGQGEFVVGAGGVVTFTPAAGFMGAVDSIRYVVADANGTLASALVSVLVRPGPTADDDAAITLQHVPVDIDALDGDAPGLTAAGAAGTLDAASLVFADGSTSHVVTGEGVFTIAAGLVTFQPEPAFTGDTTPVGYRVTDSLGNEATASITVHVNPVVPEAHDDEAFTPFNTPVEVSVAANDASGDPSAPLVADSVVFASAGQPAGATVAADGLSMTVPGEGAYEVLADGTVRFTPEESLEGFVSRVRYEIRDTNGTRTDAALTIYVLAGPQARDDAAGTPQNVSVTVDVLANDTPSGLAPGLAGEFIPGSVRLPDGSAGPMYVDGEGLYTAQADGSIVFDPDPGFTGVATPMRYAVTDTLGNSVSALVRITVAGVNPAAIDDTAATPFATPVRLAGMLNDLEGAASAPLVPGLTVFPAAGQPAGVTISPSGLALGVPGQGDFVVDADGSVVFTPALSFAGTTTPVRYRIADANGTTAEAWLQVTVREGPVADDDAASTAQHVAVVIDVLDGDVPGVDADLSAGAFDPASVEFETGAGTLVVAGEGSYVAGADGAVTFTPEPSFTGPTTPVRYWVTDSHGNTANALISVTVAAIVPVARDDAAATPFRTPVDVAVLANDDAGAATAPLMPATVVFAASGTATLDVAGEGAYVAHSDGTVTFAPADGFVGAATPVSYLVFDSNGTSVGAWIRVTVRPGPSADPESATTPQHVAIMIDVLTGDVAGLAADGSPGTLDPASLAFPADALPVSAVLGADGSLTLPGIGVFSPGAPGTVDFAPVATFSGEVPTVVYEVADSLGNVARAVIDVEVTPVVPTALDDSVAAVYGQPVLVAELANDAPGAAHEPLDPASVSLPATGQDPAVTVAPDLKHATVVGEGTYAVAADGTITFTPANGFTGDTAPVMYEVLDANGTAATAHVTITMRTAPAALPDSAVTPQNVDVTLAVLDNDTPSQRADGSAGAWQVGTVIFPPDLDVKSLTRGGAAGAEAARPRALQPAGAIVTDGGKTLTVPGEGVYRAQPDGTVVFDPEPGFVGATSTVDYEVTDVDGNIVRTTIDITIVTGGDAVSDVRTATSGVPLIVDVLVNDNAPSGLAWDPTTVCVVVGSDCLTTFARAGVGSWVANADGTITFTGESNFVGVAVLPYRVRDTAGLAYQANLTIGVQNGPVLVFTGADVTGELRLACALVLCGWAALTLAAFGRRRRAF